MFAKFTGEFRTPFDFASLVLISKMFSGFESDDFLALSCGGEQPHLCEVEDQLKSVDVIGRRDRLAGIIYKPPLIAEFAFRTTLNLANFVDFTREKVVFLRIACYCSDPECSNAL